MNKSSFTDKSNGWGKIILAGLIMMTMIGTVGCQFSNDQSEKDICQFLEAIAVNTEKSIANRDTELARDIWSELTEYSVLAQSEHEALSKAIGNVASTYGTLVQYCQEGKKEKLDAFLSSFEKESKALSKQLAKQGFKVEELDKQIDKIVNP